MISGRCASCSEGARPYGGYGRSGLGIPQPLIPGMGWLPVYLLIEAVAASRRRGSRPERPGAAG